MPDPGLPGGDMSSCMDIMMDERDMDEDSAGALCQSLKDEEKSEHGNAEELLAALERGSGLIADVGVDLVSGVDVPAIDSEWVMLKSDTDDHDYRVTTPLLKAEDTDRRISYAAAMVPREPDKEGDVAPTPTVEKAAHNFLKSDGGIDTDHSLIDGEGEPVESWVLKQDRTFDLPEGASKDYPEGTWMLGIEWGKDAWERIQAGDLTGLSIYGMADHIPLQRAASGCGCLATAKQLDIPLANDAVVHLVYESRTAAEKASEEIDLGGAVHEHEFDGMTVFMPGEDHDAFVERYMELSDAAGETAAAISGANGQSGDTHKGKANKSDSMGQEESTETESGADGASLGEVASSVQDLHETVGSVTETVESLKEVVEAEKEDSQEAAATLAETMDMAPGDVLDILEAASGKEVGEVVDLIEADSESDTDAVANESDGDDEEEEDDEMADSVDKRTADANLAKGADGTGNAQTGITSDGGSGNIPSYAAAAEHHEGNK